MVTIKAYGLLGLGSPTVLVSRSHEVRAEVEKLIANHSRVTVEDGDCIFVEILDKSEIDKLLKPYKW